MMHYKKVSAILGLFAVYCFMQVLDLVRPIVNFINNLGNMIGR